MADTAPNHDAILAALERLLAWPEMVRSPQLGNFLNYIVRRTLEGQEQSIKAYSIAVDVFGRSADFDPQSDPIVRVQARRLRALLDDYHARAGSTESVQIRLPVGRYVPEFVMAEVMPAAIEPRLAPARPAARSHVRAWVMAAILALAFVVLVFGLNRWLQGNASTGSLQPPSVAVVEFVMAEVIPAPIEPRLAPARPAARWRVRPWVVAAVLALAIVVLAFGLNRWLQGNASAGSLQPPSVAVVEFTNLSEAAADSRLASGLAIELVTDLEQFENIEVHYGGITAESQERQAEREFVLTGVVRRDGHIVRYSAMLTNADTGTVVWDHTVPVPEQEAHEPAVLDRVSNALSMILGSPRGPLHRQARALLASRQAIEPPMSLYLCHMLFDLYRETTSANDAERALACLDGLNETDRTSPMGLALGASLGAETIAANTPPDERERRYEAGLRDLEQAMIAAPVSSFVWEQYARLQEIMGMEASALTAYGSATQLNPANTDALAAYGRLLAFGGALDEARPLALDALEGAPEPPAWYYGGPALLTLADQNFTRAAQHAEIYEKADREVGAVLALVAGHGAGNAAIVNRYLPQVLEMASFRSQGILPRLRETITDPALVEMIGSGLLGAGLPPETLEQPF